MSEPIHQRTSLRDVLLDQADTVLRERGIDELSLRELARDAGVSHGAPRSHFIDRKALLDALAERGFVRLADAMRAAAATDTDYARSLRASARAYLGFAVTNQALLDLMFAAKVDAPSAALILAAERLFSTISEIVNAGERKTLLVSVTMQGIATFVGSHRISMAQGEELIDDAIALILKG
jgi:AcrR family transcriptional regulator